MNRSENFYVVTNINTQEQVVCRDAYRAAVALSPGNVFSVSSDQELAISRSMAMARAWREKYGEWKPLEGF